MLRDSVTAQTTATIAKSLDVELAPFRTIPYQPPHCVFLFFDDIILKIRTGLEAKKKAILVAYGVTTEGKRELINTQSIKRIVYAVLSHLNNQQERNL